MLQRLVTDGVRKNEEKVSKDDWSDTLYTVVLNALSSALHFPFLFCAETKHAFPSVFLLVFFLPPLQPLFFSHEWNTAESFRNFSFWLVAAIILPWTSSEICEQHTFLIHVLFAAKFRAKNVMLSYRLIVFVVSFIFIYMFDPGLKMVPILYMPHQSFLNVYRLFQIWSIWCSNMVIITIHGFSILGLNWSSSSLIIRLKYINEVTLIASIVFSHGDVVIKM